MTDFSPDNKALLPQLEFDPVLIAKETIETEQKALGTLLSQIDKRFALACDILLACTGRVVVTGMGKSGHIGRKIAATFASTGTPAFFMHPGEAGHGDLGMLTAGDVLLAISNSGESDEIRTLLPIVKSLGIALVSISRTHRGVLPSFADVALTLGQSDEACPLGLAPTSSTTATLALGDALAIALLHARGFTKDDFAMSHPAGALGKKLLTCVNDLMQQDNLPTVKKQTSIKDTLLTMTSGRLGLAVVTDDTEQVVGIFTDGDLRRHLNQNGDLSCPICQVMTSTPKTIAKNAKATHALDKMNDNNITQLLVLEQGRLQGVIGLHQLIGAGVS